MPTATPPSTPEAPRFPALDWVKAAAILAVIATHAAESYFSKSRGVADQLVTVFADFHVPCFFAASGFLYATEGRGDARSLRRRLARLLIPYLIASAIAYLVGIAKAGSVSDLLVQVALGAPIGAYYFVFVFALFIVLAWGLGAARAWVAELLLVATLAYWAVAALVPAARLQTDMFWEFRNPLNHAGYFLLGWVARLHVDSLAQVGQRSRRLALMVAAGMLAVYLAVAVPPALGAPGTPNLRVLYVLGVLALAAAIGPRSVPRPVAFLAGATYSIYLSHLFFMTAVRAGVRGFPPVARIGLLFAAGLGGAVILVVLGRRLLRPRLARLLLGA